MSPVAAGTGIDPFDAWVGALETRHMSDLTFSEIRRSIQAVSSLYVERRDSVPAARALDGAGKRAAYALFYAPLHYLIVREIVSRLGAAAPPPVRILDLGCGTGAAGAAWAVESARGGGSEGPGGAAPRLEGLDRNRWAVGETRWSYRTLGLFGISHAGGVETARLPGAGSGIIAGWVVNELGDPEREKLLPRLLDAAGRGARVLVVEPIARRATPWWKGWSQAFRRSEGRDDDWHLAARLPEILRRLDRAAGLDHSELTARSLWIDGTAK